MLCAICVTCWGNADVLGVLQGSREQPFCRFSKAAVAAVEATGVPFQTFDIFSVRMLRPVLLSDLSRPPSMISLTCRPSRTPTLHALPTLRLSFVLSLTHQSQKHIL